MLIKRLGGVVWEGGKPALSAGKYEKKGKIMSFSVGTWKQEQQWQEREYSKGDRI